MNPDVGDNPVHISTNIKMVSLLHRNLVRGAQYSLWSEDETRMYTTWCEVLESVLLKSGCLTPGEIRARHQKAEWPTDIPIITGGNKVDA